MTSDYFRPYDVTYSTCGEHGVRYRSDLRCWLCDRPELVASWWDDEPTSNLHAQLQRWRGGVDRSYTAPAGAYVEPAARTRDRAMT